MSLRQYQVDVINKLRQALAAGEKRIACYGPTGCGKSVIMEELTKLALGKGKRVAIIANRIHLIRQMEDRFRQTGIDYGVLQGANTIGIHKPVVICSINTVESRGLPDADLILIDEGHAVAGSKMYRNLLFRLNNVPCVAVTATPFSRGMAKPYKELGDEPLFQSLVVASTIRELIDMGFLVDCEIYAPSEPDLSGVRLSKNAFGEMDYSDKSAEFAEAVDKPALVGDIITHWHKLAEGKPTICFATSISHSQHIVQQFKESGVSAEHIDCYMHEDDKDSILRRFKAGEFTVLSNCALLAEGFDYPACEVMILARPTKSLIRYIQMCLDSETEILTKRGWVRHDTIIESDQVAEFCFDGSIQFDVPSQIVRRAIDSGEQMMGITSPHLDLRVTNLHEMVWAARAKAASGEWRKATAEKLASRASHYAIPVSGKASFSGVELTDDEIRFIGLWITDGTRNRKTNQVMIAQSCAQPDSHHEYIKSVLTGCGFRFGQCRIKRTKELAKYQDVMHYTVSYGRPTRLVDRHLRGWGALEFYLDKSISEDLDQMDERQFSIFIEAMNLGDGKKFRTATWTPKTLSITTGDNKLLADRLQAMCIVRGYRCNISEHSYNKSPLYMAYISKKGHACVGGTLSEKGRARLKVVAHEAGELVWCVTTKSGNIVVRRNGKVAVVGNCGRILRPVHGKTRGLLLDHSGSVKDLGFPTDDLPLELDDGRPAAQRTKEREEPKPKKCPKCSYMKPPKTAICPKCGFEAKRTPQEVAIEEGELVRMTKAPKINRDNKQQIWSECLGLAVQRGKSSGWASHLYRSITGVWPRSLMDVARDPSPGVVGKEHSNRIAYAARMNKQGGGHAIRP